MLLRLKLLRISFDRNDCNNLLERKIQIKSFFLKTFISLRMFFNEVHFIQVAYLLTINK